jgi:Uma2 family endonuclease
MITFVSEADRISVPPWIVDLASFRRWVASDDFPDSGRIWFLKGEVWIDMSKEQIFTHVQVKTEITVVLGGWVKTNQLGLFLADGAMLTNMSADISGVPDAVFVSKVSLQADRVRFVEGGEEGYVELAGAPDMVLEVISRSSVHKDTVVLRDAYWEAGIREFWLVDARGEAPTFDILRHTPKGFSATRRQGGWLKSAVFGKAFRLTRQTNALGHPEFTLEMRAGGDGR